jgi:hypothetical protein
VRLTERIQNTQNSTTAPTSAQSCAEVGSECPLPASGTNEASTSPLRVETQRRRDVRRIQPGRVSNRPGGRMEHLSGLTPPSSSTRQAIDRGFRHRCSSQSRLHRSEGGHERAGAESDSGARGHQRVHISTAWLSLAVQRSWDCSLRRRPEAPRQTDGGAMRGMEPTPCWIRHRRATGGPLRTGPALQGRCALPR